MFYNLEPNVQVFFGCCIIDIRGIKMFEKIKSAVNCYNENKLLYQKLSISLLDRSFARDDDVPLTEDEIKQIDAYWKKYAFAYPNIDYKSFETFKNRCGKFDVRHCPGHIRTGFFRKHFINNNYAKSFQNKGMLSFLFSNINQPRSMARCMDNVYLDEKFQPLSLDDLSDLCLKFVQEGTNLVVKPFFFSQGKGICFLTQENADIKYIKDILRAKSKSGFVIQEALKQSSFMDMLNDSAVNTVRITTLLFDGKVYPLAALIRVGKTGSKVDNFNAGGSLLGIDINTGKCLNWALMQDRSHSSVLPNGFDLNQELVVPNFEKLKQDVINCHYRVPYIKMISWDIALDSNDIPTLIECNFGGEIQMHEAVTGPLFGELMDGLLEKYLYLRFVKKNFICREYCDHIEIEKYIGNKDRASIPREIKEKPVTKVIKGGFVNVRIKHLPTYCKAV